VRNISSLEVQGMVKEMLASKAPRIDGFTKKFFHSFYYTWCKEICEVVEDSRRFG